jgi:hypothetical protein
MMISGVRRSRPIPAIATCKLKSGTMSVASLRNFSPLQAGLALTRRAGRWLLTGLGYTLIAIGAVGAVLPWHLGIPVLVVGLVLALRNSFRARRRFVGLQRRHPRILFPVRRLLRREPEVWPVAWQAVLRGERLILPLSWRFLGKTRRRWRR